MHPHCMLHPLHPLTRMPCNMASCAAGFLEATQLAHEAIRLDLEAPDEAELEDAEGEEEEEAEEDEEEEDDDEEEEEKRAAETEAGAMAAEEEEESEVEEWEGGVGGVARVCPLLAGADAARARLVAQRASGQSAPAHQPSMVTWGARVPTLREEEDAAAPAARAELLARCGAGATHFARRGAPAPALLAALRACLLTRSELRCAARPSPFTLVLPPNRSARLSLTPPLPHPYLAPPPPLSYPQL